MPPSLHRLANLKVYFIPIQTRMPLKFGHETLTSATLVRVGLEVVDETSRRAQGWGETPLSVQWVWPSTLPFAAREQALQRFCLELARAWMSFSLAGHALEMGWAFLERRLPGLWSEFNRQNPAPSQPAEPAAPFKPEPMPWLAALVCNSAFDLALHDAFGHLAGCPVYNTYGPEFLRHDLSYFLEPAQGSSVVFKNRYPADFLQQTPERELVAWHLVGGLDPVDAAELSGGEPNDGYPVLLGEWIKRDGLRCLKVKLRGNDSAWDLQRLIKVAQVGLPLGVEWFTADFNCTVEKTDYVSGILDQLERSCPQVYQRILYIEQPFAYDLENHQMDVSDLSRRKPLFLDESAHDWRLIRLGRALGWTGVALKTCKTQTGAILSACWARSHGMQLMVQDLTNPMLAQIPHLLLAAHVPTIMGVETNSMQFYPQASEPEARVHPGIYERRQGKVSLGSIQGPGFGYRLEEIHRVLPPPALEL